MYNSVLFLKLSILMSVLSLSAPAVSEESASKKSVSEEEEANQSISGEEPKKNNTKTGVLPKGNSSIDKDRAKKPKKRAKKRRRNCFLDLTNPPGGNGYFSPDGKMFYILANTGDEKTKGGRTNAKYTAYSVDLETFDTDAILGLSQKKGASLVTSGNPLKAVSAISFYGKSSGCYTGGLLMVTIPVNDKKIKPTKIKSKTRRQLVRSPNGYMMVDAKNSTILEIDSKTFQSRKRASYVKGQRPLWFDPSSKELIVWQRGKISGLKAVKNGKIGRKLAFKRSQRVLQQNDKFGIANLDTNKNEIEIIEHSKWSGVSKNAKYKIKIPPSYTVNSSSMDIHFEKKIALVAGANFLAKQRWQRVFVFKYDENEEMVGAIAVTGNEYLNYAGIDPTGKFAIIEVRDITTRQTVVLKIFDFEKKSFKDVRLQKPK
jgi:hypothetical protein